MTNYTADTLEKIPGATLRHIRLKTGEQADHNPLTIAPDTVYEVILQNEFNPEADAFQRVLD